MGSRTPFRRESRTQVKNSDQKAYAAAHVMHDLGCLVIQHRYESRDIKVLASVRMFPRPVLGDGHEQAAGAATFSRHVFGYELISERIAQVLPGTAVAELKLYRRLLVRSGCTQPDDPVNTRGGSAANYTLLIDGQQVPLLGNPGGPSFRNTLSAGDRNTLALAFFFASLLPQFPSRISPGAVSGTMRHLGRHATGGNELG